MRYKTISIYNRLDEQNIERCGNYRVKKKQWIEVVLLVLLMVIVLPFVIVAARALPAADDFAAWSAYDGNTLVYTWKRMISIYHTWQGTYSGVLLQGVPVYILQGLTGVRVMSVCSVVILVLSIGFSVYSSMRNKTRDFTEILVFWLVIVAYMLNNQFPQEVFWWWTGITIYTIPLSLTFVTVGICELDTNNINIRILGVIAAIIAAGGGLDITAFLCALLLISICFRYEKGCLRNGRFLYREVVFAVAFLGGILNALAPGNFERARLFRQPGEKLDYLNAVLETIHHANVELKVGIKTGVLPFVFVVILVLVYKSISEQDGSQVNMSLVRVLLLDFACYLGIVITQYPVILGMGAQMAMPGHCQFVEDISVIVFFIVGVYYTSEWFFAHAKIDFIAPIRIGFLVFSFACMLILPKDSEWMPGVLYKGIADGSVFETTKAWENALNEIESEKSSGKDLYLEVDLEKQQYWYPSLGITKEYNQGNTCVSGYYGLNSVQLK